MKYPIGLTIRTNTKDTSNPNDMVTCTIIKSYVTDKRALYDVHFTYNERPQYNHYHTHNEDTIDRYINKEGWDIIHNPTITLPDDLFKD